MAKKDGCPEPVLVSRLHIVLIYDAFEDTQSNLPLNRRKKRGKLIGYLHTHSSPRDSIEREKGALLSLLTWFLQHQSVSPAICWSNPTQRSWCQATESSVQYVQPTQACTKRILVFQLLPYVCPEPVLVK
eukprot:COSAG06_NODE_1909_length_8084_cov_66.552536_7_plen_130_part_00